MKNNIQAEVIGDLMRRKQTSREYLRSLSPAEKIARLVDLQERYYQMLVVREKTAVVRFPKMAKMAQGSLLKRRNMMENLIECNPKIMFGKPVIKGTRITVELILEKIATGESVEDILSSYPHLTREQILACVDFARRSLSLDFVYPLATV